MPSEVAQLSRRAEELEGKIAGRRQECDREGKDGHFERNGLQALLHATASQPSGVRNSLPVARKRLEKRHGRSAASHSCLESFRFSSASSFVDGVTHFFGDEVLLNMRDSLM